MNYFVKHKQLKPFNAFAKDKTHFDINQNQEIKHHLQSRKCVCK